MDRHLKLRKLAYEFAHLIPPYIFLDHWERNGELLQGCRMVFSDPHLGFSPFPGDLTARTFGQDPKAYLNAFFAGSSFFFLTNELVYGHKYQGGVEPPMLDWSVALDSNFVGNIHKFMTGKSLDANWPAFLEAATYIRRHHMNTDATPYLFENFQKAKINEKHLDFVVNGFATFYRFTTGELKTDAPSGLSDFEFALNEADAKRHARNTVEGMLSNAAFIDDETLRRWHRRDVLLALLLIAIEYYGNRHSTIRDKLTWVMSELERMVGRIPERELLFAYRAFKNSKNEPFFQDNWPIPYNKNQNIVDLVRNMAWDVSFYRTMETSATKNDNGDYFIPFFLTFDWRLAGVNDIYSSRILLIDDQDKKVYSASQSSLQSTLEDDGCWGEFEPFFTPDRIAARGGTEVSVDELANHCHDAEQELHRLVYGRPMEPS